MKIICVGRNYHNHIKELDSPYPDNPVIFLKPESAILRNGKDFYIPHFSNEIHYELELVIRIDRLGKHIQKRFAHRYYNSVSLGIDFTARDIQKKLKKLGLPWELSKSFDDSAAIGDFINIEELIDINTARFRLEKNCKIVQEACVNQMIYSIDTIISYVSGFMTLKIGDLIYTGTPSGVSKVEQGDMLIGYLNDRELINIIIK
jgi:2-keto-4-pentenoate hydratase/2-oxohepta-3-ene-1,7-dioic acid hydratase in catechol pathway